MGYDIHKRAQKAPSFTPNPTGIALADLAQGTNGQVPVAQTSGDTTYRSLTGDITISSTGVTAVPTMLRIAHAVYSFAADGGTQGLITPVTTAVIPIRAIIIATVINSTTAAGSTGSATIAIGTSAGSAANSLLLATGKASFTTNALLSGVPITSDATKWVKMTAAGSITFTVAAADLNAGIIDVTVVYVVASA